MAVGIKVEALKAWFGKNQALHGITMDVAPGKATAIIGPSGCGKSTFVRCLNRMHETIPGARAEGSVQVGGEDIYAPGTSAVQVRRKIGMVFQKPNPFPTMSIYDNVAAGLRLNGAARGREIDATVERCLRSAALWEEVKDSLKKSSGASLSGGQQQRLCIARALAVEPEVLLMDEPASALDPISTAKIEALIYNLKQSYTIIVVTHNMQQAARISDETGFFLTGRLVEFNETKKIVTDIERIGDIAVNIGERAMELIQEPELKRLLDLPIMADAAQKILKEGLDAFVNSDADLAEKVILNDNVVDDLYEQIFRELLTYMLEDTRSISRSIKLIFIAKALERVGDHSANVAEMVVFLVRGQDIRHGTRLDRG